MEFREYLASETTIQAKDILLIIICSVIFGIFRVIINRLILRPLSVFANKNKREKFVNRGFDLIHYWISTILGTLAFSQRPYFHCPFYMLDCAEYVRQTGEFFTCSVLEKIYYIYFASYYFSDIFWVHTSGDTKILIFHHICTIILIATCVIVARPVFGLSIMLLHDYGDAFLYLGKVATYIGKKTLADISLVIFAILFFWLRLFGCASIIYIIVKINKIYPQTHHVGLYYFADITFCFLYCCHIVWGIDIIRAVIKVFKGSNVHDTRSDKGYSRTKID
jgi:hypothetical protein